MACWDSVRNKDIGQVKQGLYVYFSYFLIYRLKHVLRGGVQYVMKKPIYNSIYKRVKILCHMPNKRSKRRRYNGAYNIILYFQI